jgi:glucose repression regulatory protein TUP1
MSPNLSSQHKHLQPQGAPNQSVQQSAVGLSSGHARLNDSFDAIRQEFDAILQDASILRSAKEEADAGREFLSGFPFIGQRPAVF